MESDSSTSEIISPKIPQKKVSIQKVEKLATHPQQTRGSSRHSVQKVASPVESESSVVEKTGGDGNESFLDSISNKFSSNPNYRYIAIGVVLLAIGGYYLYVTKFKPNQDGNKLVNGAAKQSVQQERSAKLPMPKQNPSDNEMQMLRRQLMQKQQNENQLLMERQQMIEQLEMQRMQLASVQNANSQNNNSLNLNIDNKRLVHPNDNMDEEDDEINIDDLNVDEKPIVSQHNLTKEEMEQINNKLK